METSHGITKKAALLIAAKKLFGERGYTETTFKKISDRARVALGLLTHHYGSKEKLFLACGLDVLENFLVVLHDAVDHVDTGREAVLSFCRAYLDFSVDPSSDWLVLVRCSPYSDMKTRADRDIMNAKFTEVYEVLTAAIIRGLRDGSLVGIEPRTTTSVIISIMVGVNRTRVLTPYAPPNLYEEALAFIDRALSPRAATSQI